MALGVRGEIGWDDISDVTTVYISGRDEISSDQVAKPLRAVGVDLVVVGAGFGHLKFLYLAVGQTICIYILSAFASIKTFKAGIEPATRAAKPMTPRGRTL